MELYLLKWEDSGYCLHSKRHYIFFIQTKDKASKVRCKPLPDSALCWFYSALRTEDLACFCHGERLLVSLSLWVWGTNRASCWMRRDESYKGKDLGKPSKTKVTKEWHPWNGMSSMEIAGSSAHWFSTLGSASYNVSVSQMLRLWKNCNLCVGCSQSWWSSQEAYLKTWSII